MLFEFRQRDSWSYCCAMLMLLICFIDVTSFSSLWKQYSVSIQRGNWKQMVILDQLKIKDMPASTDVVSFQYSVVQSRRKLPQVRHGHSFVLRHLIRSIPSTLFSMPFSVSRCSAPSDWYLGFLILFCPMSNANGPSIDCFFLKRYMIVCCANHMYYETGFRC